MECQVVYRPKYPEICSPADCNHHGAHQLSIGTRFESGKRGRRHITTDAVICMRCGKELVGAYDWGASMNAAWAEFGWQQTIGSRLHDLVKARAADGYLTWPADEQAECSGGGYVVPLGAMAWAIPE